MLTVKREQIGIYLRLVFQGDYTFRNATDLNQLFLEFLQHNVTHYLLDFRHLKKCHSSILSPLLKLRQTVKSKGKIILYLFPPDLYLFLKIAQLESNFEFCDSLDSLLKEEQHEIKVNLAIQKLIESQSTIDFMTDSSPR